MKQFLQVCLVLCLTICGFVQADLQSALNSPDRSDQDKAMDEKRKPADAIEFFGIGPGMSVIDIFAGGGYYTEIVSRVVGDSGFVTMYNNTPWDNFVGNAVEQRLANDRLPNVDKYVAPPEELTNLPDKYDAGLFILGMHDIYYKDEKDGWPEIDKQRFLKGIYNVIKDGGVLGVIDHNAAPGSDAAVVSKELHRIDPAIIIADLEAVGFKLEARSDMLSNVADDHSISVFDPAMRRSTDRSVLRFRK